MFWKKKKDVSKPELNIRTRNNGVLHKEREIQEYIWYLEKEKVGLTEELNAIRPILEDPNIKPPVSAKCSECKFAVFGPKHHMVTSAYSVHRATTQQLLGCRKDGLCDDFKPMEDE